MNRAKIFIAFTFLLAFAVCVSAQEQTSKIVWKNLQDKYEKFEDVKPTIVNLSEMPIYFDCNLEFFESQKASSYIEQSNNTRLLYFDEQRNTWDWNVMICGTVSKEEKAELKKKYAEVKRLQKEGKYIPTGCKIDPNEEFALNFNNSQWLRLFSGDGIGPTYKSGKFKFALNYWWYNSQKDNGQQNSGSPEFWILPKEETK